MNLSKLMIIELCKCGNAALAEAKQIADEPKHPLKDEKCKT